MQIDNSCRISFKAKLDKTNPRGVIIGSETFIAGGVVLLTHDFCRDLHINTVIGKRCFIGVNAIIMPGVIIGDQVIVGSGSVVTKNIPSNKIVAGNPAKVIRSNIKTKKFGQLII